MNLIILCHLALVYNLRFSCLYVVYLMQFLCRSVRNFLIVQYIMIIIIMSIPPKGRSFTASPGTKAAVLIKGRSSTANSETQAAVLLSMYRCGSFPLLSAPYSPFSIWADLKRSEKIPGASTCRWGEWIWLTGPSGLHRNSPQRLNISFIRVFDQIRDPEIPITLRPNLYIGL